MVLHWVLMLEVNIEIWTRTLLFNVIQALKAVAEIVAVLLQCVLCILKHRA